MKLDRALEVFEYNKAMLTCDMSISRDPEHQDVTPDYYGKDAEDLYYAIVCVEEYIKSAIPIEWILNKYIEKWEKAEMGRRDFQFCEVIHDLLEMWDKENDK